ncbi:MAG: dihydroorotase [Mucinivorans sp.]
MIIIHNGTIINRGEAFEGFVVIDGDRIQHVGRGSFDLGACDVSSRDALAAAQLIDADGGYIMPGAIDDQVHFRDPGLTYKGDIESESRAAVAGGVTSFMDMPNTVPQTTTVELLSAKHERAAAVSRANYSFYMGATNDNIKEINKIDRSLTPGVKVFMGSSTGNMLVDRIASLEAIFAESPVLVATHCEDEATIQANIKLWGDGAKIEDHPLIRSAEACYRSSSLAAQIATKYNTRLHILHLSTAREMSIFESRPLADKRITGEVCVHHLWFTDRDYATKGNLIKWNPAIKSESDRAALRSSLLSGRVDIVATDHAPHTLEEKQRPYILAPGGGPLVQHSLVAMLEMFPAIEVARLMSHRVAECFGVVDRGYIEAGQFADIVVVNQKQWRVSRENILYKCGWSPFMDQEFRFQVSTTLVNGRVAYGDGKVNDSVRGRALTYKVKA